MGKLAADALAAAGAPHRLSYAGNMFSIFFTDADVTDYATAYVNEEGKFMPREIDGKPGPGAPNMRATDFMVPGIGLMPGDYIAGPNHVLPTGRTARFSSALGVYDFIKRTSTLSYSQEAFELVSKSVAALAECEGLTAHANSVVVRGRE